MLTRLSEPDLSPGILSAVPRSLGIAAPSDVFNSSQLQSLISQGRSTLTQIATEYSNGNPKLAKGIEAQLETALNLYEQDKELPLELNLGMNRIIAAAVASFFMISTEPGYSGTVLWKSIS